MSFYKKCVLEIVISDHGDVREFECMVDNHCRHSESEEIFEGVECECCGKNMREWRCVKCGDVINVKHK